MATTTTPTPIAGLNAQDQAFMDSWYQAVKDHPAASKKYTEWGTALAKKPTYDEKLAYIRAIVNNTDSKYKDKIPPLAVNWLVESNPGVVDSKGDAFSKDFYKGIISGDTKTQTANSTALKTAKTKVATESAKLANPKATPAELAAIVADIVNGSSTKPYNPATLNTAVSSTPSASLYKAGSKSADELKSTYGGILDPDTGERLFSDDYLKKVASATTASDVQGFNDTLSKVASKVLASQKGSNYLVQSDADKANALTNLLKNPDTLASGTKSLYDSAESKTGLAGLLPVGSFKDDKGNFVYNGGEIQPKDMSEFVQTYNNQGIANRGAYVAPTFNSDTKMYESKSTSPYANALTSLLGSTKNPFASDYKSSLAQPAAMTSTQLASLNKPFKENTTARDIINLQNSAGLPTGNELTKGSSLSKNLLDLYQTNPDGSAINSPWVADTEDMVIPTTTIPTIDTSTELVQLDPGGLLHGNTVIDPNLAANQATAAGIDTLSGSTVGGPAVNPRTGKPNYTVRNPTGFTANDLQLMEAMGWTPEQLKANNEQFAIERAKEADAYASSQRISNIIDSWKSPEDRWKWFAENPNDPYTLMAKEDITLPANYMTPPKKKGMITDPYILDQLAMDDELDREFKNVFHNYPYFLANMGTISANNKRTLIDEQLRANELGAPSTVVTSPVVTTTSGVNPGTPAEIEARRIATDKLIAEQQAAEELRKKDLQQKMSQFSLTKAPETSQPIYVPPTTLTKVPETETSQPIYVPPTTLTKAPETSQPIYVPPTTLTKVPETSQPIYVPPTTLTKIPETETSQPFNAGIVTPNVTSIVSPNNMSTFTLGPNGETGIPINLSPANTANQNAGITSLTGQQLENQAVNAGYQGDYTDTAAMQGYLSSLPR
jgi:hypothetical protein